MEYLSSIPSLLFLSVVWIAWISFMFSLAIARAIKMKSEETQTPVGGILPFKSREEFLKARMEMDLGEFLDRTYITPKDITRWKRPEVVTAQGPVLPHPNGRIFTGIDGSASVGQLGWGSPGGAGGFPSIGGSGGMAGTALQGSPGSAVGFPSIAGGGGATEPTTPVKEGCWYRLKQNGELVICKESFQGAGGYFICENGAILPFLDYDVEVAIPRIGETWLLNMCPSHGSSIMRYRVGIDYPCVKPENADCWIRFTLCGCSVPFEFGHGKI